MSIRYPVRFNIRPYKSRLFFRVLIFETKADMYAFYVEYSKQVGMDEAPGSHTTDEFGIAKAGTYDPRPLFDAIVMPYHWVAKKGVKPPNHIGVILFYKGRMGAGVISHEFGHAAFHHRRVLMGFGKKDLNLGRHTTQLEELCLYDLAAMVKKFVNKCYKLKIY